MELLEVQTLEASDLQIGGRLGSKRLEGRPWKHPFVYLIGLVDYQSPSFIIIMLIELPSFRVLPRRLFEQVVAGLITITS